MYHPFQQFVSVAGDDVHQMIPSFSFQLLDPRDRISREGEAFLTLTYATDDFHDHIDLDDDDDDEEEEEEFESNRSSYSPRLSSSSSSSSQATTKPTITIDCLDPIAAADFDRSCLSAESALDDQLLVCPKQAFVDMCWEDAIRGTADVDAAPPADHPLDHSSSGNDPTEDDDASSPVIDIDTALLYLAASQQRRRRDSRRMSWVGSTSQLSDTLSLGESSESSSVNGDGGEEAEEGEDDDPTTPVFGRPEDAVSNNDILYEEKTFEVTTDWYPALLPTTTKLFISDLDRHPHSDADSRYDYYYDDDRKSSISSSAASFTDTIDSDFLKFALSSANPLDSIGYFPTMPPSKKSRRKKQTETTESRSSKGGLLTRTRTFWSSLPKRLKG